MKKGNNDVMMYVYVLYLPRNIQDLTRRILYQNISCIVSKIFYNLIIVTIFKKFWSLISIIIKTIRDPINIKSLNRDLTQIDATNGHTT